MRQIKKVGILGAGMMGSDIALSCALRGFEVLMKEVSLDLAQKGLQQIEKNLEKWAAKGRIQESEAQRKEALLRITPTNSFEGFQDTDIVIEAIFEDLEIKAQNYNQLEEICKPTCIIASNTSSIPITKLSATLKNSARKSRFLGLHFFSPASIMELVEVISGEETSEETAKLATDFCFAIGKEPINVSDCAGFVVNRILGAINDEAIRLCEERVATPEDIDKACKLGLGHPVGPFALMDTVSNELNLKIMRIFHENYGERFLPRPALVRKVDAGHFGRKTGKGWFNYDL